ncbi:hypothetical protein AAMO2058_001615500 [Amorphochlora amoebiformis]
MDTKASGKAKRSETSRAVVVYEEKDNKVKWMYLKTRKVKIGHFSLEIEQMTAHHAAGTGAVMWPAAVGLSRYLQSQLGASVIVTDGDPRVLPTLSRNLERNSKTGIQKTKPGDPPVVLKYSWGDIPSSKWGVIDYIIASDVIYQEEYFSDLLKSLKFCASDHTIIILAYKIRYTQQRKFFPRAKKAGFSVRHVESQLVDQDSRTNGVEITILQKIPNRTRAPQLDTCSPTGHVLPNRTRVPQPDTCTSEPTIHS